MATTLKQQIRKVIRAHYGYHLGSFRVDANYNDGIELFVVDLAKILKGKIKGNTEWHRDLAKHTRADGLDAEVGGKVKEIRLKKSVTVKELAKKMGVHPDFLEDFERGDQVVFFETVAQILGHLKTNLKERRYVLNSSWEALSLKRHVQDVIELYYGRSLWFFNSKVSYEESITPFTGVVGKVFGAANYKIISTDNLTAYKSLFQFGSQCRLARTTKTRDSNNKRHGFTLG